MRTMIPSILILVLLLGSNPALAQLPPEITADAHLLRAEQAIRDGDFARARDEIDKISLLQKEHELDLSEEFHFRAAKAAAAAGLPKGALEAVVNYLTAVGRGGPRYVEALELMNQAQDAISGKQSHGHRGRVHHRWRWRVRIQSTSSPRSGIWSMLPG